MPQKFVSKRARDSPSSATSVSPTRVYPALLTRTSMRWNLARVSRMLASIEVVDVTSRGSLRMLGVVGRVERAEGLRAVATRRFVGWWVVMCCARACPIPEEQPVTKFGGNMG